MHWQLWTAILLLSWNSAPSPVQAAETTDLHLLQNWEPQLLTQLNSGSSVDYPSLGYAQSPFPRGGYNRRRRLPGRAKAAPTTTTQRPFRRVWNNFVRSVQPNFGLRNLTNPLTNLFNNGNANIIETVPVHTMMETDEKEQQSPTTTTQSPSKNKRKRRKQQKRRPMFDSVEQDDTFDYYSPVAVAQQQPVFYYGPNVGSFYDLRRLHDFNNQASFYDQYYEDSYPEEESEYRPQNNLGKLNAQQLTVLRPLGLAIKMPSIESVADYEKKENVANDDVVSSAANEDADATVSDVGSKDDDSVDSAAPNDVSNPALSESMRNALGTYMNDDQQSRQRQRQSDRQSETGAPAKVKPRQWQRFIFAPRLVNLPNNHE